MRKMNVLSWWFRIAALVALLLVSGITSRAQGPIRAVSVSTVLKPPFSLYLSDYATPGPGKCSVIINFRDLAEPSWNIYLSLKIESMYVKLETSPNFRPATPITITPGAPITLNGEELAEYFNTKNLEFSGITQAGYQKSGHLPEGMYTFSFEARDYASGKVISTSIPFTANIQLADPPVVLRPARGEVIKPLTPQFTTFQWQIQNADPATTQYVLHLYEIIDTTVQPNTAIANNQVRKIFESDPANYMTFLYDASAPQLEDGKIYSYYIQAINADGKEICRNNGKSEVSWFSYGYPRNGKIELKFPEDDHGFTLREDRIFQWTAPNNLLTGQQYNYQIKVVELKDGENPDSAMDAKAGWFEYGTPVSNRSYPYNFNFRKQGKELESMERYAWQVKAFTEDKEIARSPVQTFTGPPCMEAFKAGNHTIYVSKVEKGCDFEHLTGEGRVIISKTKRYHTVRFKDIQLQRSGAELVMVKGVCSAPCEIEKFPLTPELSENGKAYFHADSLIVDKASMRIRGKVKWDLPHPALSEEKPVLESQVVYLNFDTYTLLGKAIIKENTSFSLLDPYEFGLALDNKSFFFVRDSNRYFMDISGKVILPGSVARNSSSPVEFSFFNKTQLYYLEGNTVPAVSFLPVENTSVTLQPTQYVVDFSETRSPALYADNKKWKGVFCSGYNVRFPELFDTKGQLANVKPQTDSIKNPDGKNHLLTVTDEGLNFTYKRIVKDSLKVVFNTFPGLVTAYDINVLRNLVQTSSLKGTIKIPVLSETKNFAFTVPLTGMGFMAGYLDESLDNYKFAYNEARGDQKILITIVRAVFANKERLDMTIDLEWPKINAVMPKVGGFKVWGNYDIGFGIPGGAVSLDNRVSGKMDDFTLFVDGIGATREKGNYALGTTVTVQMSEDVAGANGPPVANLYSITANRLLDGEVAVYTAAQTKAREQAALDKNNGGAESGDVTDERLLKQRQMMQEQQLLSKTMLQSKFEMFDFAAGQILELQENVDSAELEKPLVATPKVKKDTTETTGKRKTLAPDDQAEMFKRSLIVVSRLTSGLTTEIDKFTVPLRNKISNSRDSVNQKIDEAIGKLFVGVESKIKEKLAGVSSTIPLDDVLLTITNEVKTTTINTLTGRLNTFVDTEILPELDLSTKLNTALADVLTNASSEVIIGGIDVISGTFIENQLEDLKSRTIGGFSSSALKNKLTAKKNALIATIDPISIIEEIYGRVTSNLGKMAEEILVAKTTELVSKAVNEVANNVLNKVTENIPLDFSNLGLKIAPGGKVGLDPVRIAMNTGILSLNGEINYTRDDPKFGNIWKGDITVSVNAPIKFSLPVVYITGKKDDLKYWFCQVNGAKDLADKTPQPISNEVKLGPVKLVAASGRVYHNMKDLGNDIVPDKSIDYGASMGLVLFDSQKNGQTVRLALSATYVVETSGDYIIDFVGDCQLVSTSVSITKGDPNAMGQVEVRLNYNSAEKHFLGYGKVIIKKTGVLCAQASIMVDLMPGKWAIAIGSRDERVIFVPACYGWSPTGWLFVNQEMAELGLGLQFSIMAEAGFDIGIVALKVRLDAGIAFGIIASAQYSPKFVLLSAGAWAEVWAKVIVDYKINLLIKVKGSVTLVDLYAKATLLIIFNPPPSSLEGNASGYLKLAGIVNCDFDASFKKTL